MIYLKSMLISHQEDFLLVLFHNTVNITTRHIFPSQQTIALGIILRAIRVCFNPPPGSEYYKLLCLDSFHGSTHINDKHSKIMRRKSCYVYNVLHPDCAKTFARISIQRLCTPDSITQKNTAHLLNCSRAFTR